MPPRKNTAAARKRRPALPRGFGLYSFKRQMEWLNSNGYDKEAQQIKTELQAQSRQVAQ